jgi:predicted HTH transcriptional regulator
MEPALWEIDKYDEFLAERRELIADETNKFLQELKEETKEKLKEVDWKEIIVKGENNFVEFKSSMRWDYKENQVNKNLEYVIAKTISGFLNSEGGTLIIGVDDDGVILGLDKDYSTLGKKQNRDGFLLALVQIINNYLGKEFNQYISVKIENIDGKDVGIVEISDSGSPVFINYQGSDQFFIRASASTQPMSMKEANEYISLHWNNGK